MALICINFFSCETAELWRNRLQDFRKCKLIGQFETNFVQVLLDPPLPSAFPLFHFREGEEGLAARLNACGSNSE